MNKIIKCIAVSSIIMNFASRAQNDSIRRPHPISPGYNQTQYDKSNPSSPMYNQTQRDPMVNPSTPRYNQTQRDYDRSNNPSTPGDTRTNRDKPKKDRPK